jgi:inosose dehydratase
MSDIELACHVAPWGTAGFITGLADVEAAGYRGLEMTAELVEQYEDRVGVFTEILAQHHLTLIAITAGGATWPGMNLDEEVERNLNVARFLKAAGARCLTLYPPRPNPDHPIEDDLDLMPAATAYGEIARRTLELEVFTCLHPDSGTCVDSAKTLSKFIQMADPEALKLCVDSGFLAEAGIGAASFLKEHRKRLGLVHLRDLKFRESRARKSGGGKHGKAVPQATTVELGKGQVDLPGFVNALLAVEYLGWATVELDAADRRRLGDAAQACHTYAEQKLDLVL